MTQTALVTGATKGIGRALVENLTRRGVTTYATGRDEMALAEVKDRTGAFGSPFDLAKPGAAEELYADACEVLRGAPDFLVNNAGYNSRKAHFTEVTNEELDQQYAVNLRSPLILCRLAMCDMQKRLPEQDGARGHIVNVISTVVHRGIETMGVYSAMKHGLHGATRVLVKEARPLGIKVSGVYPGGTDSDFRAAERPDYMSPDSVAKMIADVLFSPPDVVVHELTFRPMVESNF